MADSIERRKLPRISVKWPVTIFTDKGRVRGEARNITTTGAYVVCKEKLRQNETYRMLFGLAKHSITVDAEIIWSSVDSNKQGSLTTGMGVFFAKMNEYDRQRLKEVILSRREK